MAYIYNIPQPTDQLSVSQGQILGNFTALGAIAGNGSASSSALNSTSGFNWLYLPPQGSTPPAGALFTAGNVGLYSANDSVTGKNELYINKTNNSGVVQIAATESILGTTNPIPGSFGGTGWTMLPSGLKLVWGTDVGSNSGVKTVTLTGAQIFAHTILSVQTTIFGNSSSMVQALIRVQSIGANTFNVVVTNITSTAYDNSNFMYFCIGY